MEQIIPFSVCVNYHDYLDCALEKNRRLFREYHIMTTLQDIETQAVCAKHDVTVHFYDYLNVNNAKFNKSGMINTLQQTLHAAHPEKWMLTLDADIVLPDTFCELFEALEPTLQKHALYSLPRLDFHKYDDYVGCVNGVKYGGMNFMGFFQLYHDKTKYYDHFSSSCRTCDFKFYRSFREHILLDKTEEYHVHHLGVDTKNHFGRKTPPWKPSDGTST